MSSSPETSVGLDRLPSELYNDILNALRPVDLARLGRVSRRLHQVTRPGLWKRVCFLSRDGNHVASPWTGSSAHFASLCQGVTVSSPRPYWTVSKAVINACVSCSCAYEEQGGFHDDADGGTEDLHGQLRLLPPNSLREFSWLLGVCVPGSILGAGGALARQRELREISLVTGYDRLGIRCLARNVDLSAFLHLRKFSWVGIHSLQLPIVRNTLAAVCDQLTDLELDFLGTPYVEEWFNLTAVPSKLRWAVTRHAVVAASGAESSSTATSQPNHDSQPAMPNLVSLSLTNTIMGRTSIESMLDIEKLETLKLRRCPGWQDVLRSAFERERRMADGDDGDDGDDGQPGDSPRLLKLKRLELHLFQLGQQLPGQGSAATFYRCLSRLAEVCPDLEDMVMYAMTRLSRNWPHHATDGLDVLRSDDARLGTPLGHLMLILAPLFKSPKHRLRRLVCHVRPPTGYGFDEQQVFEPPPLFPPAPSSSVLLLDDSFPRIQVDYFGITAPLQFLSVFFREARSRGSFNGVRVIHVRQDHDDGRARLPHDNWATGFGLPDVASARDAAVNLERMLTPEFYELATFLFSKEGIPSLRALAFGDFTSLDPTARLVVCPDDTGREVRLLREDDGELLDLLDEHAEAILAGPDYAKPFLRSDGASMSRNIWRKNWTARIARESARRRPTIPRADDDDDDGNDEVSS